MHAPSPACRARITLRQLPLPHAITCRLLCRCRRLRWLFRMHPDLSLSVYHHLKSSGSSSLHCRISRTSHRCIFHDISRRLRPVASYIIDSHYLVIDSVAFSFFGIYSYVLYLLDLIYSYPPTTPTPLLFSLLSSLFTFYTRPTLWTDVGSITLPSPLIFSYACSSLLSSISGLPCRLFIRFVAHLLLVVASSSIALK
ncbi:hypothetical protein L227DRAFT_359836 [Lentinus tigrinus ALCF2SS1-6]|uniref:Uncharacterized protein n=1 Tax=Lentinus tigrinus ALCF2SS1-6 TaxID=1328759 RepID=A0A5C2SJ91_9APHY|nr:hypothetical protein L227DRAFT_359836 [Lentinus tigrinus ALCF2SS1-6]